VKLPRSSGKLSVEVELLHQPVPPEALDGLLESSGAEASALARSYARASKAPKTMHGLTLDH
jgi:hypothetical protein